MSVKAIRGAITVKKNSEEDILTATKELLLTIIEKNNLSVDKIINAWFTTTIDLNAAFPARAAREIGWNKVPLMCAQEIDVPGALPLCIRVMLLIDHDAEQEVQHVYLGDAKNLRKDVSL